MRNYQELVFEIKYFENNDVVTASTTFNDNVAGAPSSWGDDWIGRRIEK